MEDKKLCDLGYESVNLYFSAICNLRCKYCFQPKVAGINKDTNKKVIEWISSGRLEDDILDLFGKDITNISLWGGEPSINLPYLTERIPEYFKKFPKLRNINFSSNVSRKNLCNNIIDLIKKVSEENIKSNRCMSIDVQFSIDGPPEINDFNRVGSKAEKIIDNITYICKKIKDIDPRYYNLSIKATTSKESLKWMMTNNNLEYYYDFFNEHQKHWESIIGDKAPYGGTCIYFVYPGNFTKEDGILFYELCKKQNSKEFKEKYKDCNVIFENQISLRIKKCLSTIRAGYYRPYKGEMLSICSCCAGKSSLGLTESGNIHICQATYMFDDNVIKYIEDNNIVSDFESTQGFSFRNFKNVIQNNIVVSKNDKVRLYRLLNNMKVFCSDIATKIQYFEVMIPQLAMAGQIDKKYLDSKYRDLAIAYLLFGGHECPADNIWEFGSPYIRSLAQTRLVLNGAFDFYLDNFYKDILDLKYE